MSEQSRAAKLVSPLDAHPVPDINTFAAALCEIERRIAGRSGDRGPAFDIASRVLDVVHALEQETIDARRYR